MALPAHRQGGVGWGQGPASCRKVHGVQQLGPRVDGISAGIERGSAEDAGTPVLHPGARSLWDLQRTGESWGGVAGTSGSWGLLQGLVL